MSVAPNWRASCCRGFVSAHRDSSFGAEPPGGQDGEQPDRPVPDDGDGLSWLDVGGDGAEPARAEDVGGCEQARDELVRRNVGGGYQGAVGERYPGQLGLGADGAHQLGVHAAALVPGPADLACVVRGPE
jgi:hypothetical protein